MGTGPHSAEVDRGEHPDQQRQNCELLHGLRGTRPEFSQVSDKQIGVRGAGGQAYEPDQPRHLDSHETAECFRGRKGKGPPVSANREATSAKHAMTTPTAPAASITPGCWPDPLSREDGRQSKDAAADDAVHRRARPGSSGRSRALALRLEDALGSRFGHGEFVSQKAEWLNVDVEPRAGLLRGPGNFGADRECTNVLRGGTVRKPASERRKLPWRHTA